MEIKESLIRYLAGVRTALIGKAEGLSESDARSPRTATGTNLAGLVKHCAMIEHGYLVECLGQPSPLALPCRTRASESAAGSRHRARP